MAQKRSIARRSDQVGPDGVTGPEFKAALRGLSISQRELASRTGITVNTVNRWATGGLPVPRYAEYILELLQDRQRLRDQLA